MNYLIFPSPVCFIGGSSWPTTHWFATHQWVLTPQFGNHLFRCLQQPRNPEVSAWWCCLVMCFTSPPLTPGFSGVVDPKTWKTADITSSCQGRVSWLSSYCCVLVTPMVSSWPSKTCILSGFFTLTSEISLISHWVENQCHLGSPARQRRLYLSTMSYSPHSPSLSSPALQSPLGSSAEWICLWHRLISLSESWWQFSNEAQSPSKDGLIKTTIIRTGESERERERGGGNQRNISAI